jgi:hypothetical protein
MTFSLKPTFTPLATCSHEQSLLRSRKFDRSTLSMQEPWMHGELVSWKQRHNISETAFKELHAIQNGSHTDPSGFYPSPPSISTMLPDNSAAFGHGMYDVSLGFHNIQDSTHSYNHLVDSASDTEEQPVSFCEQKSQQVIVRKEHGVKSKRRNRGEECATCWKNKKAVRAPPRSMI